MPSLARLGSVLMAAPVRPDGQGSEADSWASTWDAKFLSLLGLRITGRTYVTKANSTPKSHFEHCGNPFICNVSSSSVLVRGRPSPLSDNRPHWAFSLS